MGLFQRARRTISELIGSARHIISVYANQIWSHRPSFDWNRVDYAFYDRLWRGQAHGLEKSGLLVKPIVSKIIAWMLGQLPEIVISEDENLQAGVNDWFADNHGDVLRGALESFKLGDSFLVMNGDGTISVVPPDIVFPIVDEEDYSQIIGWRVMAVHPHPESAKTMRIQDDYYADRRVRTKMIDGQMVDEPEMFRNPLGRIPVVHVPGPNRGVNDRFGRPFVEPMLPALHDYGQLLDAGMDGNYRQGRPVFAMNFGSTKELNDFWSRYGKTESRQKQDGTYEDDTYLDIDLEGIVTFANAQGDFKSPAPSSGDTMNYLQILYYLIFENAEIPEFLMGSAIQGSKASAETQMPPFVKFIEMMQKLAETWVLDLIDLVIAYQRAAVMRRTAMAISVRVAWAKLTDDDHRLALDTLKWSYASGLIDDENAVRLMPVEIEDPEAMLNKLRADAAQAKKDNGDAFDAAMRRDAVADEADAQMWDELLDIGKRQPYTENGHSNGHVERSLVMS